MDVKLSPVRELDLDTLDYLTNDQDGAGPHQWYGWHDPHKHRKRWEEDGYLGDDGGYLMIVAGEERIGFVAWRKMVTSRPAYCWAMGIIVGSAHRGRGYGTRAQRLLVEYLFAHTPVNRIEAATEITNLGEQRALEKAGFTREGVLRGSGFRDGEWHDGLLYGIVRADLKG